ncbi:MAG: hypothetical protein FJ333_10425 [Sphingomonadales bacterium]|nr:hypothetical protein [Sphingomonadales bacterium]
MPSPYVKKARPKKMSQYDQAVMDEAVKACKDGLMSVRGAAKHYNLPKSTLQDRVSETHGKQHGRPTVLTEDEELYIVEMVEQCAEWGFPFTQVRGVPRILGEGGDIYRYRIRRLTPPPEITKLPVPVPVLTGNKCAARRAARFFLLRRSCPLMHPAT